MPSNINPFGLITNSTVYSGTNAYDKIMEEIKVIYDTMKTSFGPLGMDKLCCDLSNNLLITNDGATIISNMILNNNNFANIIQSLAISQDKHVGDGTTTVCLLSYLLIRNGMDLIKNKKVSASTVVNGYRMAYNEIIKNIREISSNNNNSSNSINLTNLTNNLIRTAISSKILSEDEEYFIKLLKEFYELNKTKNKNVKNLNMAKSVGKSITDTRILNTFLLNCSVAHECMLKKNTNISILCCDFGLLKEKMPLTVNIQCDVENLDKIRQTEIDLTKKKCQTIIKSGAKLILFTGGIDEICMKIFIDNNITAVRRVDIRDMINIVGEDHIIKNVDQDYSYSNTLSKKYSFEVKQHGEYNLVEISDVENTLNTLLINGPNRQICDEVERAVIDAMNILINKNSSDLNFDQNSNVSNISNFNCLPGGGAVEGWLYKVLKQFGNNLSMKEHVAVFEYADALKQLVTAMCENGGYSGEEIFSRILLSEDDNNTNSKNAKVSVENMKGVDLLTNTIQNNLEHGIVEPTKYKVKALKAATEAAISILRVNEIIEINE